MDSSNQYKKQNPDPLKQELPPWRAFKVLRHNPGYDPTGNVAGQWNPVENVMVAAHAIEFSSDGIICFVSYMPMGDSFIQHMPRIFKDWLDVEEIVTTGSAH